MSKMDAMDTQRPDQPTIEASPPIEVRDVAPEDAYRILFGTPKVEDVGEKPSEGELLLLDDDADGTLDEDFVEDDDRTLDDVDAVEEVGAE